MNNIMNKKTKHATFWLTDNIYEKIIYLSKLNKCSRSEVIRRLVEQSKDLIN